jgi:hypothetical protein
VRVALRLTLLLTCAAVFAPRAGAVGPTQLALMPLPKHVLGPDAASLTLTPDSGVDSNAVAARHAGAGYTAADLTRTGRVTGYTLDFARLLPRPLSGSATLLEVESIAELYRGTPAATKGLTFWRGVTRALEGRTVDGVSVSLAPFAAAVGNGTFAFELTYSLAHMPLAYVGDVVFRSGDLLGAVFVTTTARSGLEARTVALARVLASRMRAVLRGKIRRG